MPAPRVRTPPPGRTLRRQGEATRAKLLVAALPALAEAGYRGARIDDIVTRAGVSHGTFYRYFTNKDDLFRALAAQCADEASELAESLERVAPGAEGREALRAWIRAYIELYRRYGVVIRAWTENQVEDRQLSRIGVKSFNRFSEALRAAIAVDPAHPTRREELKAHALQAMLERLAYVITSRDVGLGDDVVIDNLATFVHRGWFTPPR